MTFVVLQLSGRSSIVTNALLGRAIVCSNKKALVARGPYAVYDWPARDCITWNISSELVFACIKNSVSGGGSAMDGVLRDISTGYWKARSYHHHDVPEGLGVFPVPWSSRWSWSLHLFLGRPMFLPSFGLYCVACFGSLCPSSVHVEATFSGTVLFILLCYVLPFLSNTLILFFYLVLLFQVSVSKIESVK